MVDVPSRPSSRGDNLTLACSPVHHLGPGNFREPLMKYLERITQRGCALSSRPRFRSTPRKRISLGSASLLLVGRKAAEAGSSLRTVSWLQLKGVRSWGGGPIFHRLPPRGRALRILEL